MGRDYEWNEEEDWMTLTFYINEGPRYKVRNVAFLGNQIYDNAILSDGLKLHAGEYFDRTKMNTDIGYVKDLYGTNGYVFADAQPDLQFELEPGIVDLVYKVTEGDQCVVGDIRRAHRRRQPAHADPHRHPSARLSAGRHRRHSQDPRERATDQVVRLVQRRPEQGRRAADRAYAAGG